MFQRRPVEDENVFQIIRNKLQQYGGQNKGHCSVEAFRGLFQPKWHPEQPIQAVMRLKYCVFLVVLVDFGLPVPKGSVQYREDCRPSQTIDEFIHAREGL